MRETGRGWNADRRRPAADPVRARSAASPDEGDRVDGWDVVELPGHADGHLGFLLRPDGVLVAGDHILPEITPAVGVYPEVTRPDPLGAYLDLSPEDDRALASRPRPAQAHGDPIADPAGRPPARSSTTTRERLDET